MASIIKKKKKGNFYYYAVESKRVNGKPRITWQKYLGTIKSIIAAKDNQSPPKPSELIISNFGAIAALLRIALQFDLFNIINQFFPEKKKGPSIAHYLILAAINRAIKPKSKNKMPQWYEDSILFRLWKFNPSLFNSQRFWGSMDIIDENHIQVIEKEISKKIVKKYGIPIDCLLYDTTNFFTYISSFNDRCSLAQRGNSKAKRNDLRQIGLALLVSRHFHIPLFHKTYQGNQNDSSVFNTISEELFNFLRNISPNINDITIVFDKGNNSEDNFTAIEKNRLHFVASLVPSNFDELTEIPLEKFQKLQNLKWPETKAYTTKKVLFGEERTVVITFSETFFTKQLASTCIQITQCIQKLKNLADQLYNWRIGKIKKGKKPTVQSIERKVAAILSPQHMKDIIHTEVKKIGDLPYLDFETKKKTLNEISSKIFGKTILFSSRNNWSIDDIIAAYRGQFEIENAFKDMKNIEYLHWQPMFHWTNQKIKVHAFYCVLALTLTGIIRKELAQNDIPLSIDEIFENLNYIKEAIVFYPKSENGHPKPHFLFSKMSPLQKKIFEILDLNSMSIVG